MRRYVGLDVHSKSSVFVIEGDVGEVLARGEVPTTFEGFRLLLSRYDLPAGTSVALETGTVSFFVARQLSRLGLVPVVVDAHEVRLKAHRPNFKSDRRDAFELCEGLRRGIYRSIVHVPPEPIQLLRETLSRRRHFVRLAASQINAAKRLLRSWGLSHLGRSLRTEAGWSRLLRTLPVEEKRFKELLESHRILWSCAQQQIRNLEATLALQREPFARELNALQTVPGVGPVVATTTIAVFSDVSRFASPKHAVSYAGLAPSTHQSADRDTHGHISKRGSAELRAMLCEAAHHASRPTSPFNPYFTKLCARHGHKLAVTAIAHRLCRILFAMLRDHADFDIRKLAIEAGPFQKTIVRPYRLKPATAVRA